MSFGCLHVLFVQIVQPPAPKIVPLDIYLMKLDVQLYNAPATVVHHHVG